MAFKIYEKDKQPDKDVYLKLVFDGDDLDLVACDEYGETYTAGYLLEITSDGKLCLYSDVDEALGFCLDKNGRIQVEK